MFNFFCNRKKQKYYSSFAKLDILRTVLASQFKPESGLIFKLPVTSSKRLGLMSKVSSIDALLKSGQCSDSQFNILLNDTREICQIHRKKSFLFGLRPFWKTDSEKELARYFDSNNRYVYR